MKYKVLWIDDDCNTTGSNFIGQAEQYEVDLIAFESHEEGIAYLDNNFDTIDAVILDAKVKLRKEDTVAKLDGLKASRDKLIEFNQTDDLPFFIFTGQPDYVSNDIFRESYGEFYVKGEDEEKLIQDLIDRIEQKEDYILKKKYKTLLSSCSDSFLGHDNYSRLFNLVKDIENGSKINNSEDMLTAVRKIVEGLFSALGKLEIIPSNLIGTKGWINGSSLFLSGKHSDYQLLQDIVPPIIRFNIYKLLAIIQDGSHAYGDLKYEVDKYLKNSKSDYLFRSCVYSLFDLVLWFNEFVSNNGDIESNRSKWEIVGVEEGWVSGIVLRIADNGYGTFLPNSSKITISILPEMVQSNGLDEGETISVRVEPSPDGTKDYIKGIKK